MMMAFQGASLSHLMSSPLTPTLMVMLFQQTLWARTNTFVARLFCRVKHVSARWNKSESKVKCPESGTQRDTRNSGFSGKRSLSECNKKLSEFFFRTPSNPILGKRFYCERIWSFFAWRGVDKLKRRTPCDAHVCLWLFVYQQYVRLFSQATG